MSANHEKIIHRRTALKVLAGGVGIAVASPYIIRSAYAAETLTVRGNGGISGEACAKAFYRPFTEETGIKVVGVASQLEPLSQVRTIVNSGTYFWDVALLSLQAQDILGKAGFLDEVDQNAPNVVDILPEAKSKWGVSYHVYGVVLAYNKETYGANGPQNWADAFDAKKFPGRRALRKFPVDTLEAAILADGVALKDVYPIDIERAFKKLDAIKKDVAVWWSNSAQAAQLISTREVDIISTYNGRVQDAIDNGAPFEIVWNQGIWGADGHAIPRGNPKAKLAHDFVKFCARPDRQAEYSKQIPYAPTNPKAFEFISAERAKILPATPDRIGNMLMVNSEYWAANLEKVSQRFNQWITQ